MKKTIIISGFPGTGKSYAYNNQNKLGLEMLDSDSSIFSWSYNGDTKLTQRNPDFPNNYMRHIKENIGKVDVIFVSSHDVVQLALESNKIEYIIIYPDIKSKNEYLQKYKKRGNSIDFINFLSKNWNDFISNIENNPYPKKIKLGQGEFVFDIIKYLYINNHFNL